MYEDRNEGSDREPTDEAFDAGESLRLGEDVRILLVAVGGGAVRVGASVARRHVRYLETVAVNCDSRVQEVDEFDRRIYLGADAAPSDGTQGSAATAGRLARLAEPALDRLFDGATLVTIVASLGGGTGTGALPYVVEAASRNAEFVTVFAVKPFSVEGDRRALAERALARLHFLEAFAEKRDRHHGSVHVLDNDRLAASHGSLPVRRWAEHWGEIVAHHVLEEFVVPLEVAVEAHRLERLADTTSRRIAPGGYVDPARPTPGIDPPSPPMPLAPQLDVGGDVELTFEVFGPGAGERLSG